MRTPVIAGNWKMYKTVAEATALVQEMRGELVALSSVERVLCPPFTALSAVAGLVQGTGIGVGAQDMYWEKEGAFTGEISPLMVRELAGYVIIGHSERRQFFGETDETVNRKVHAALAHGLTPIVCVGENLAQNEAGETESFVSSQVRNGLAGLTPEQARGLIVAYEPIWAIGKSYRESMSATDIHEATLVIKKIVSENFGRDIANSLKILYGGSVEPENAGSILNNGPSIFRFN